MELAVWIEKVPQRLPHSLGEQLPDDEGDVFVCVPPRKRDPVERPKDTSSAGLVIAQLRVININCTQKKNVGLCLCLVEICQLLTSSQSNVADVAGVAG